MKHRGCSAFKDNGQPCNSPRLRDSDYCLMHSPEHAEEVAEARRLGGIRRRREVAITGAYDLGGLETVADIRRLIEIAVLDTLGLENSVARSRTLAYLAQVALRALETGELESRVAMLETAVRGKHRRMDSVIDGDADLAPFPSEEAFS